MITNSVGRYQIFSRTGLTLKQYKFLIINKYRCLKLVVVIVADFVNAIHGRRIHASGLEGPIPSGISLLTKIKDMRISDLNGTETTFPHLSNMKNMVKLILRSCGISGGIPMYIGTMSSLQTWNLFGSSSLENNLYIFFPYYCGGAEVTNGSIVYEEDVGLSGASTFFMSRYNCASSSTGKYLDNNCRVDYNTPRNTSGLLMNDYSLYMTARVSLLSLTYYGFCLLNWNYIVNLHFGEIIFTNDKTYGSLGRRLFDIYIQGQLVLLDFDIEDEAGGVGKAVVKKFTAIVTDLRGLDMKTRIFTLRHIIDATDNFSSENKIGEGGFGPVFKGRLSDGTMIAVKQLSSKSNQGSREFVNEIGLISALRHPNLVRPYGCCIERNQLLLVYEYMENNSIAYALFGKQECQVTLAWKTRRKICIGVAKALAYLHEESRLKIVHRDIKATNILLDKNLNPMVS